MNLLAKNSNLLYEENGNELKFFYRSWISSITPKIFSDKLSEENDKEGKLLEWVTILIIVLSKECFKKKSEKSFIELFFSKNMDEGKSSYDFWKPYFGDVIEILNHLLEKTMESNIPSLINDEKVNSSMNFQATHNDVSYFITAFESFACLINVSEKSKTLEILHNENLLNFINHLIEVFSFFKQVFLHYLFGNCS